MPASTARAKGEVSVTQEGQDVRLEVRTGGSGSTPSRLARAISVWRAYGKGCDSSAAG